MYVRAAVAAMAGYVPGEQPTDPNVVKLNTNENPYPPSPRVLDAVRAVSAEHLRRYPPPMADAFCAAAAAALNVPTDWLLATNGGDELLDMLFRAIVGEGEHVAWLRPSYSLYGVLAAIEAGRIHEVPFNPDWSFRPADLLAADPRLVLVVNPNAPSGTCVSMEVLTQLAAGLRARSAVLVVDEAYVDFADASCLDLLRQFDNVVLLRSMSKGYSLAGVRFGFGIMQPALRSELLKVKPSYNVDALAIAAATAAMVDQPYAQDTWARVRAERSRLTSELARRGFQMPTSYSNFLWCRPPQTNSQPAGKLYHFLKSHGILIRHWTDPTISDRVRVTIGTPQQNTRLLEHIDAWLNG